jgi:hypothetical protein
MRHGCRQSEAIVVVFLSLLALGRAPLLQAQNSTSTSIIDGRVEDASAAVLPGAVVTITNPSNGYRQSGVSNSAGLFSFPGVPIGTYTLTSSASGFKIVQVNDVSALVGQTTTITVKMEVGDVTQNVQVSAAAEVLNTSDPSISSVVGELMIENLPSLRREYTDFALLSPSVTVDGQFGSVSFAGTQGDYTSNYAHGNGGNAFSVDGANATSRYLSEQRMETRVPYLFGSESVQEFQVSENPYSAAYGGGSAGYVNTVTKSGTNAFHGDAFYYNRNTATGAIDAVSKANGYPKALDVRQQFGAGLGGPIVKDKLFFFFDYEQQRRKDPISIINTSQAAVNETSFGVPAGTPLPSPTGYPVPSGLTAAAPSNPLYLQQVSNALSEIQTNLGFYPRRQDDLVLFERVDLLATSKDQISMRYNYNTFTSPGSATSNPISTTGYTAYVNDAAQDHDALVHWTHVVNPSLLLDTHVFYSRNNDQTSPSGLAPPGFSPSVKLTVPSAFAIGNSALNDIREHEWGFSEHVSLTKGRHVLDFGADITYDGDVSVSFTGYEGVYTFTSPTAFALGQYSLYSQSSGQPVYRINFPTYGFYIDDTYKVNPKLTLTFGFRQDWQVYPQPPLNPQVPLTGRYQNDFDRWSPRAGFAYNVFPHTVIRGGLGIFRPFLSSDNYITSTTSNGLASLRSSLSLNYNSALAPNAQSLIFPNILPTTSALFAASPNVTVIAPGFKDPSTDQASLQVEQQLASSFTVTVGSIWTHSEHLISSSYYDLNQIRPTGTTQYIVCPPGTVTVPCAGTNSVSLLNLDSGTLKDGAVYPGVGQVDALVSPGNSNYVSGFTQFRQNYHHGFSATMSYTLSHNIQSNGFNFNNQWSYANTKGPTLLDQRHKVVVGLVYQSQYSGSGFKKALLSNWTISTITQYGSGHPYAGILSTACVGTSLKTCTGGSNLNDSAFNYSNGIAGGGPSPNIGLNSFYGPWDGTIDLNLERAWNIKEFGKITFRVTGFNMLNSPNYYVYSGSGINQQQYRPVGPTCGNKSQEQTCYLIPNNGVGGFGTFSVVQQNTGPRIFQFALIYRF